ncbi:ABC transporter substrate-binding protein [Pseudomonas canadensis]|uniref:ABC transporter substrate-binding protein n=1 Tax=Pseudomonas canadensis TaxID=915099 RepID=UPI00336AA5BE
MKYAMLWLVMLCCAAQAQAYPVTVVDLAGRSVTFTKPPQRIFLQDGNDLLTLALLDRENPFKRLVGWHNVLGSSDPSVWAQLQERWPAAAQVPDIAFDATGSVDKEALLRTRPDLIIAQLGARTGIEQTALDDLLQRLDITVLYVDLEQDPLRNAVRSVKLLGKVLDQQQRAQNYSNFYAVRLAPLLDAAQNAPKPRVFIEVRAGQSGLDHCCMSQGRVAWGLMIEGVGGKNIAAEYLVGNSGDIALETLIRLKPDHYIMTGSQRRNTGSSTIPFGYHSDSTQAHQALDLLVSRRGFAALAKDPQQCVHGLYHQFYKSVFNIVGLEYLARIIHPQQLADVQPMNTYNEIIQRFTEIPQAPVLLGVRQTFAGGGCSE